MYINWDIGFVNQKYKSYVNIYTGKIFAVIAEA